MIAISNLEDLHSIKEALERINKYQPNLFEKWLHVINLTRQLQFRYHYMGCLLTNEDPGRFVPKCAPSVLSLYKSEIAKLKEDKEAETLLQLLHDYSKVGYSQISLLTLNQNPESLVGVSAV